MILYNWSLFIDYNNLFLSPLARNWTEISRQTKDQKGGKECRFWSSTQRRSTSWTPLDSWRCGNPKWRSIQNRLQDHPETTHFIPWNRWGQSRRWWRVLGHSQKQIWRIDSHHKSEHWRSKAVSLTWWSRIHTLELSTYFNYQWNNATKDG